MGGNPSPRCSLMGRHGIGVCREWLNFVRRPGTIKSRLPLCNRPFPSHNATSGKTWRSRRGGRRGWKPQRLDRMREKIFLLLNDSRLYKRENSSIIYKKSQMRCDPPHQTGRCWVGLLLMVVNESFYRVMHDILYFLTDGNIWILYKACHTVVFIWLCHVCFFSLDSLHLLGPLWQSQDKNSFLCLCDSHRHRKDRFVQTFSHPLCWITPLPYTPSMKQRRLLFPLSPLYSNGPGRFLSFFFFSSTQQYIK